MCIALRATKQQALHRSSSKAWNYSPAPLIRGREGGQGLSVTTSASNVSGSLLIA